MVPLCAVKSLLGFVGWFVWLICFIILLLLLKQGLCISSVS